MNYDSLTGSALIDMFNSGHTHCYMVIPHMNQIGVHLYETPTAFFLAIHSVKALVQAS